MNHDEIEFLMTEQQNPGTENLDIADEGEFLAMMEQANRDAARAVEDARPQLQRALHEITQRMLRGGRLIYCGAGTSGRLGVLDASECPPTFGVEDNLVVGLIAGGDRALRLSSESSEDHMELGEKDMQGIDLSEKDALVAIAASGRTPYCIGAMRYARRAGAAVIALVCNHQTKMGEEADITVELLTGAEVLTGSTRMKAGTATKMALNALSTGAMVGLGKVYKNLMVDMKATNDKLHARAVRMFMTATGTPDEPHAMEMLARAGGCVKTAIVMEKTGADKETAEQLLGAYQGHTRQTIAQYQQK